MSTHPSIKNYSKYFKSHTFYQRQKIKTKSIPWTKLPFSNRFELLDFLKKNPAKSTDHYVLHIRDQSSGSLVPLPFSKKDFSSLIKVEKKHFSLMGITAKDRISIVGFSSSYEVYLAQALLDCGATYVPLEGNEDEQLAQLTQEKLTAIFGLAHEIEKLLTYLEATQQTISLKKILTAGQKINDFDSFCQRVKKYTNAQVIDSIGAAEVGPIALRTTTSHGYFFLPDNYIEIIDPITHQPSSSGELVITTLWKKDFPLIRYKTGDSITLNQLETKKQRRFVFSEISRKNDNLVKINGALLSIPGLVTAIDAQMHHQYFFDKVLWKFLPKIHYVVIISSHNTDDRVEIIVSGRRSTFSLRKIGQLQTVIASQLYTKPDIYKVYNRDFFKFFSRSSVLDLRGLPAKHPLAVKVNTWLQSIKTSPLSQ